MISEFNLKDIDFVNELLSQFNFNILESSLNNTFFKVKVYKEETIKGVLVYDLFYDRIEIEYIAVHDQYKNQGIGTKLISSIEDNNIKNISLEVSEENITAINFYKKNGYKVVAKRKNYYKDKDAYLMLKELGE